MGEVMGSRLIRIFAEGLLGVVESGLRVAQVRWSELSGPPAL